MADRVGQQVGSYRLLRLLGRGGFAEVYLGEHTRLLSQAAIKVLSAQLAEAEAEQFEIEARTLARLTHPHIVRILDFAVQDGAPFLVMDYAPNGTLRQRYRRGVPQEPRAFLPYLQQVAGALHYAHEQRLIHRDIKPENMLLDRRQAALLSDFGIAVTLHASHSSTTQEVVGTASYMAPEQIQAHPRPASDQYALAVVVYEWLTGERPFIGSMTEIMAKHLFTPPQPPRERVPDLAPALEAVVLRALEKDPAARWQSVLAFAEAFEQALAPTVPRPSAPAQAVQPSVPTLPPVFSDPTMPAAHSPDSAPVSSPTTPAGGWRPTPAAAATVRPAPEGTVIPPAREPSPAPTWDVRQEERPHATMPEEAWQAAPTQPGAAGVPQAPVPPRGGMSRRTLLIGGAAALVTLSGAGATALALSSRQPPQPTTNTGHLHTSPTATTITKGGRLFLYNTQDRPYSLTWSPDSKRILSGSWEDPVADAKSGSVVSWDALTGYNPITYQAQLNIASAVAWSPDGALVAAAIYERGMLYIWDAATGAQKQAIKIGGFYYEAPNHTIGSSTAALAWSPNGQYLAIGNIGNPLRLLDTSTFQVAQTYNPGDFTGDASWMGIYALSWSPDSSSLIAFCPTADQAGTGTGIIWDVTSQQGRALFTGPYYEMFVPAWSPDGASIATGEDDGAVTLWDVASGRPRWQIPLIGTEVVWSPDSKYLAATQQGEGTVLLDSSTGKVVFTNFDSSGNLAWSPNGAMLACSNGNVIVVMKAS